MGSPFGIIPMGDYYDLQTEWTENIETCNPVQRLTDFIYFIYRKCKTAGSQ